MQGFQDQSVTFDIERAANLLASAAFISSTTHLNLSEDTTYQATSANPSAHGTLLDLPVNVWAIVATSLSSRAIEALRLTSRDTAQLVDSLLIRRLRLCPTVQWLLAHQHTGTTGLLPARYPALTDLSLRPASAHDFIRRIDLVTCLSVLGPCLRLLSLHLAGWPSVSLHHSKPTTSAGSSIYDRLPTWVPALRTLVLDGGGSGSGDSGGSGGAACLTDVDVAALSRLPCLRRLALRFHVFGPRDAQRHHRVRPCPDLGPLTRLTALQLVGVVPNQATASALAPLNDLEHLHLDLFHDGYDKGMQALDLRNHTRLTSLIFRARPQSLWNWVVGSVGGGRGGGLSLPTTPPMPCPATLRQTLQHLPPSLQSLAVELPPWRPRFELAQRWRSRSQPRGHPTSSKAGPAEASTSYSACVSGSAGGNGGSGSAAGGDDVGKQSGVSEGPTLQQLGCPPALLPSLRDLDLPLRHLTCLRLCSLPQPAGARPAADGGGDGRTSLLTPYGSVFTSLEWRPAAGPACGPCSCCITQPSGGEHCMGGWGSHDRGYCKGGAPVADVHDAHEARDADRGLMRTQAPPARPPLQPRDEDVLLVAATRPREVYELRDVLEALQCMRTEGRPWGSVAGPSAAAAAGDAAAVTGGTDGGPGISADGDDDQEPLGHLEVNVRVDCAQESALLRLLTAAPNPSMPQPRDPRDGPERPSSRPPPSLPVATSQRSPTVTPPSPSGLQRPADAMVRRPGPPSLDLYLCLDRNVQPAALVASLGASAAVASALRHLALTNMSCSAIRRETAEARTRRPMMADPSQSGQHARESDNSDLWFGEGPPQLDPAGAPTELTDLEPLAAAQPQAAAAAAEEAAEVVVRREAAFSSGAANAREVSPSPRQATSPLVVALMRLNRLCTLTLQPVHNMLAELHPLAAHPSLRVLRLGDVEEDGESVAQRPLLRRLAGLMLALGDPRQGCDPQQGDPRVGWDGQAEPPAVSGLGGDVERGIGALSGRRERWVLVVPQLMGWEVELLNREVEADTGGRCLCEVSS